MSKLNKLKGLVMDNIPDVESLVVLLELSIEDILDRHPDALLENADKFGEFDEGQYSGQDYEEDVEEEGYVHEWDE